MKMYRGNEIEVFISKNFRNFNTKQKRSRARIWVTQPKNISVLRIFGLVEKWRNPMPRSDHLSLQKRNNKR